MATFHVITQGDQAVVEPVLSDEPTDAELEAYLTAVQNICTAQQCTLRAAVVEANLTEGQDTITFAFTDPDPHDQFAQVTLEHGPLVITESLTIRGPEVAGVQISGNNSTRLFEFPAVGNYVLEGLTLSHANGVGTNRDLDGDGIADPPDGSGGAINSSRAGSSLTIRDSLVRENSGELGGAIALFGGTLNIEDTAIINNEAVEVGGAMVVAGDITLTNVTVSGNRVTAPASEEPEAGGISAQTVFNNDGSAAPTDVLIRQSTIADNSAPTAANLLAIAQGANVSFDLQNTIIAAPQGGGQNVDVCNSANSEGSCSGNVTFTSLGNNIVDDDTINLSEPSDFSNTDARLAPLWLDDCPVCPILLGHPLLHGSPAIDGGANIGISTDQRGVARPIGNGVDIGAFEMQFDFGDAKAGFPTRLIVNANGDVTEDGARHIATGLMLGATRGPEGDGIPSENADGDGADEDGVTFGVIDVAEATANVTVNVQGNGGQLDAWIDFNGDGSWDDADEQVFASHAVANGSNELMFDVPSGAVGGTAHARFRLSTSGGLQPSGAASDGEVEDYAVTILDGIDFGDAPDSEAGTGEGNYRTLEADNGARHKRGGPRLGNLADSELDGLPSDLADGDNLDKDDDEDGVTFGSFAIGQLEPTGEITVNVQEASGKLDAWIDFNRDGDWSDDGEQIFTSQSVSTGDNEFTIDLPTGLEAGDTYARFRVSSDGGLDPTGFADDGEVEDYLISLAPGIDFGDAPDLATGSAEGDYQTLLADDGARHSIGTLRLGSSVDTEGDAFQSAIANGDDSSMEDDDENGITFGPIQQGQVNVVAFVDVEGAAGKLDAWIDFNMDGDWNDDGEQIFASQDVVVGNNKVTFDLPETLDEGTTFARFRLSTAGGLSPRGPTDDGEVEDYQIEILPIGDDFGDAPSAYPTARHTIGNLRLGCFVDTEASAVSSNEATGDDDDNFDDEDGITFLDDFIRDQSTRIEADVVGGSGFLNAWVDFNQDNDFDDQFEHVVINRAVEGDEVKGASFFVPVTARTGDTVIRFRLSSTAGLQPDGSASDGEVEDYEIRIAASGGGSPTFDYGSAPGHYPSRPEQNGARHTVGSLFLGSGVDAEFGPGPESEDDGVVASASILTFAEASSTGSFSITASDGFGKVNAWVDFNQDSDWDDPGEQIYNDEDVAAGLNVLDFTVPAGALPGATFARFRLSSGGGLSPTGTSFAGEVEDHVVTLVNGDVEGGAEVEVTAPAPGTIEVVQGSIIVRTRDPDSILFTGPDGSISTLNITGTDGDDTLNIEDVPGVEVTGDALGGHDTLGLLGSGFDLDLTQVDDNAIRGIEAIDITGSGDNSLTLDVAEVEAVSDAGELSVLSDVGDTVEVGSGWTLTGTEVSNGRFFRIVEQAGARLRLHGPAHWQNPILPEDVNGSGSVEPIDILLIINEILDPRYHNADALLVDPATIDDFDGNYRDTNGDGILAPIDVLLIVDLYAADGAGEGEVPPAPTNVSLLALADSDVRAPAARDDGELMPLASPSIDLVSRPLLPSRLGIASDPHHFSDVVEQLAADDELVDLALNSALDELFRNGR